MPTTSTRQQWWVKPDWTGTPQESATSPGKGWHGPYATLDAAFKAELDNLGSANVGIAPGLPAISQGKGSVLGGLNDFLGRLTQANTWLRVAEFVIGIVLLAVGVARLTNAVPAATKIARVAAKGVLA